MGLEVHVWVCLLGAVAWSAEPSSTEQLLVRRLDAAMAELSQAAEVPHYTALTVSDWHEVNLTARDGTLAWRADEHSRYLDVDLRVGTPELDSTHPLRGFSALEGDERGALSVPLDDGFAMEHAVWRELDQRYRDAVERIVVLRANLNVKVEEEDPAPDFQPLAKGAVSREAVPELQLDLDAWAPAMVAASERLESVPEVVQHSISLDADRVRTTLVDTEGARLEHGRRHVRLSMHLQGVADDGDQVSVFRAVDVHDARRLPSPDSLMDWASEAIDDLKARRSAPRGEPYSGPVMLEGRAAAVFFHEVLGHRVEGHRQKRDTEGKTFADHVGRAVLPPWIDVVDDPTLAELAGEQLNGHYAYDDEAIAAAPAVLVDDGVFTGFLMSRSPIEGFPHSNGHGRRSTGRMPLARMGNTVVTAEGGVPRQELRRRLLQQVREQGLEYGYVVDEIEGGFTMTGRVMPNAFNVRASTTWRVFADGRPDELVRGIDLVGTPLVAFSQLIAAGDDPQVFNGSCGAESGWVPVSAVAPSLLFSKLEFQLKEKADDRPPLLPKPVLGDDGEGA
jgi:predicted Zn-dependent protease